MYSFHVTYDDKAFRHFDGGPCSIAIKPLAPGIYELKVQRGTDDFFFRTALGELVFFHDGNGNQLTAAQTQSLTPIAAVNHTQYEGRFRYGESVMKEGKAYSHTLISVKKGPTWFVLNTGITQFKAPGTEHVYEAFRPWVNQVVARFED